MTNKPLTYRQRLVRFIVELLGQRYDDPRLDCTNAEHPAFARGFRHACLACSREITLITTTQVLSAPKERINALNGYARRLHKTHSQQETEA